MGAPLSHVLRRRRRRLAPTEQLLKKLTRVALCFEGARRNLSRPSWLDDAYRTLDRAVLAAYGWPADITDDDILARLLALNQQRAAATQQKTKVPV